jgi:HlyD family secretion protein
VKVAFREAGGSGPVAGRTVIVPKTAVRQQGGRDVVLVMQGGRAERRAVTVSLSRSEEAVISAGVAAGERVIVDGPTDLADGAAVKEKQGRP